MTTRLRGGSCGGSKHCVEISGRLTGTLSRGPAGVPDVGSSLTIRVSGTIASLGKVSATGTVHGTGFVARGQETLRLRLTAPGGTVTIGADAVSCREERRRSVRRLGGPRRRRSRHRSGRE